MQRSTVFGSCVQSVGTAASVLFAIINRCGHFSDKPRDNTITRQAKILYISLLESVQKERGEWQGFSLSFESNDNNKVDEIALMTPREVLTSSIEELSTNDQLDLLSEILDVSFRNLMGPLVPFELYTRQKKVMMQQSLAVPPTLTTLLAIRDLLTQLERDVQHCLLRLFALWDLIALVNYESQPLSKTIAEKYDHIFSESSEFQNRTTRKSERQDVVAMNLLQVMVLYRDLLFSDIEFILTKQELRINAQLLKTNSVLWSTDTESVSFKKDDRFWSDSDIGSSCSDENQMLHDDTLADSLGHHAALNSSRSRFTSPVEYEDQDLEIEARRDWSVPRPCHHTDHSEDRNLRSRKNMCYSRTTDSFAASSNDNIILHCQADHLTLERIPSGRRRSQRSLASNLNSPTPSANSQASSSTKSTLRRANVQTSQSSSFRERIDRQQDTNRTEVRSPQSSRSNFRSKRTHRSRIGSTSRSEDFSQPMDMTIPERVFQNDEKATKRRDVPIFSSIVIPVAAATLCVIATWTTLAIHDMRKAPRS
ncbi:uncharacterized protein PHALS_09792 [Plasmopara halstedii]|uniref:Uncharacterized protein n=1 Tax=Plasmopara halstedii TaxID=4781 RepID=A0A0P1AG83_PLAHL|nr:uncharacterized protein PHALS_09792 [Plasmopara halstedii]CEG39550.1 hypothetical protein PHALS_09792 [Plasmopara halstedii]|eukprot:XP_024575919.1 hypothetical protein PHALS_09792 [Plasmopara halstedii]